MSKYACFIAVLALSVGASSGFAASAKWAAADSTLNVCTASGTGTLATGSGQTVTLFNLTCNVEQNASGTTPAEATMDGPNWVVITPLSMHLSAAQSLFVTPSLVTGLYTETQVKGGNGQQSATATAKVLLRVVDVTGCSLNSTSTCTSETVAEPAVDCTASTFGCDSPDGSTFGVAFDERIQQLTANLGTITTTSGGTTTTVPEMIDLALSTADGHSFGFAFDDMSTGTHQVVVEAAVEASTSVTSSTSAGAISAAAFGLGLTTAESVNLTPGANDMDF